MVMLLLVSAIMPLPILKLLGTSISMLHPYNIKLEVVRSMGVVDINMMTYALSQTVGLFYAFMLHPCNMEAEVGRPCNEGELLRCWCWPTLPFQDSCLDQCDEAASV